MGFPPMPRNTLPEFGARFYARLDRTASGLRASYRLVDSNGLLAHTDARPFGFPLTNNTHFGPEVPELRPEILAYAIV